jgi:hypothetical protein
MVLFLRLRDESFSMINGFPFVLAKHFKQKFAKLGPNS